MEHQSKHIHKIEASREVQPLVRKRPSMQQIWRKLEASPLKAERYSTDKLWCKPLQQPVR